MKRLRKFSVIVLFLGFLIAGSTGSTAAQTTPTDTQSLKNIPFLELVDLKVTLTSEIAELEQVLKDLPQKISAAEKIGRDLERVTDQLKRLNEIKVRRDEDNQTIFRLTTESNILKDQLGGKTADALKAELQTKQMQLIEKKATMQNVRKTLASIYTPEQSFKLWMSITFAALIGFVIIGFFLLSYIDPTIRQAIFSGQTGIQFLTLFSLVIAIILFGITAILQDKELAALLGGLSGYILGRYNRSKDETDSTAPAQPPAPAAVPAPAPPPAPPVNEGLPA